jgi:hypothetical protein
MSERGDVLSLGGRWFCVKADDGWIRCVGPDAPLHLPPCTEEEARRWLALEPE